MVVLNDISPIYMNLNVATNSWKAHWIYFEASAIYSIEGHSYDNVFIWQMSGI